MKHYSKTRQNSNIVATGIGSGIALVFSVLLTGLLANLTLKGSIDQNKAGIYVFAIRAISVAAGIIIGKVFITQKYLLTACLTGCLYLIVITIAGITIYGNSLYHIGECALSVLLGSTTACILTVNKQGRKTKHRTKYEH